MEVKRLGDIFNVINGYAFKSNKYVNEGVRIIRITNVQKGYIMNENPKFYSQIDMKYLSKYFLMENDILVSLTGNVGRVGIISSDLLPAALNQRVACLRLKNNLADIKYLYYFLNSDYFENICIESAKGIAQKNLSTDLLNDVKILLPPLQTQKKIVEVLDKAQELIVARKQQIKLLDDLISSVFYNMFGDPVTNPKGWKIEKLGSIGDLQRGKSKHRPRNAPELLGGEYPLVQTGDIANAGYYLNSYSQTYSEIGLKQSKMWKKGTLCITIAANIARTSILGFDACFPDSIVAFLPSKHVNNMYIQIWLSFLQHIIEDGAPESAQKNINLKILNNLDIPVPPIDLQNQFGQIVQQIENQKQLMEQSLTEMENNFNNLMQIAFARKLFKE